MWNRTMELGRSKWNFHLLVLLSVIYLSMIGSFVFRDLSVGSDTQTYYEDFHHLELKNLEWGWFFLNYLVYQIFGDFKALLAICGIFTIYFLNKSLKNFAFSPLLSLFLFTFVCFLLYFNILRQCLALSIFYYFGIKYIKEEKLIPFLISIFIAISFHTSAVVLLPFYFMTNKLLKIKFYWLIWILSLIILLSQSSGLLDYIIENLSSFSGLISQNYLTVNEFYYQEESRNIYSLLVFNLFILISLIYFNKLKKNRLEIIFFNLYFWLILLTNITHQHYVLRRSIVYSYAALAFLLPNLKIILSKDGDKYKSILLKILIIAFAIFYFVKTYYLGNAGEIFNQYI